MNHLTIMGIRTASATCNRSLNRSRSPTDARHTTPSLADPAHTPTQDRAARPGLAGVIQPRDVGMFEAREDVSLALIVPLEVPSKSRQLRDLQCDFTPVRAVGAAREPDLGHASAAQFTHEFIRPDAITRPQPRVNCSCRGSMNCGRRSSSNETTSFLVAASDECSARGPRVQEATHQAILACANVQVEGFVQQSADPAQFSGRDPIRLSLRAIPFRGSKTRVWNPRVHFNATRDRLAFCHRGRPYAP